MADLIRNGKQAPRVSRRRALLVYFSGSSATDRLAKQIAARTGFDVDMIESDYPRSGLMGFVQSRFEVISQWLPPVRSRSNPADYDLVIIGSPVWGRSPAAPVQSWLRQHAHELREVALFCTTRATGAWETLRRMASLCGREPVAVLLATNAEVEAARHQVDLERFLDCIDDEMALTPAAFHELAAVPEVAVAAPVLAAANAA